MGDQYVEFGAGCSLCVDGDTEFFMATRSKTLFAMRPALQVGVLQDL